MSEDAVAQTTSSQPSTNAATAAPTSASGAGPLAAEPLATGEEEAVDELLAEEDGGSQQHRRKRKYPEPSFVIERSRGVGKRGSYTNAFKLRAAEFTRVVCEDGHPVGNTGAAKILGVAKKRVIMWVKEEEKIKSMIQAKPKLSSAKSCNVGAAASTADVDQVLEEYINDQRKQHRGCGNMEVMNKLLEIKPDALGGLPATATPEQAEQFRAKFSNWYKRFRKRRGCERSLVESAEDHP